MKETLRDQIAELAAMNVPALREEHRKMFGEEPVSSHRQFLFRKIAWRLQADHEGGLPESARERARGIARDTPLRTRVVTNAEKRRAGLPTEQTAVTTIRPGHDSRLPMPGGLIVAHNMNTRQADPRYVEFITTHPELETNFVNTGASGIGITLKKR